MFWSILTWSGRTLSSATTPSQSGPGSEGNEGILSIPQSSSTTGTPPSDCVVSYPGHSLGGYPSAEMQSVYSTAPAVRASKEYLKPYNYMQIICSKNSNTLCSFNNNLLLNGVRVSSMGQIYLLENY